jgi:hypothetical protein
MEPRTPYFVNRREALNKFKQLLIRERVRVLGFQAPPGFGKSFLLREIILQCKGIGVKAALLETAREFIPNHWHIIRQIVDRWPDAMARSAAILERIESLQGPLEALPGGGIVITGGTVNVTGDLVGGQKLVVESDAVGYEYHGLKIQGNRSFFLDLADLYNLEKPIKGSNNSNEVPVIDPDTPDQNGLGQDQYGQLVVLLFDNIDRATQETSTWLAEILRRIWLGDLEGLRVVLTYQNIPEKLAATADDCLETLFLAPFSIKYIEQYLTLFGLPLSEAKLVFDYSDGGIPVEVNTLVKRRHKRIR